MTYQDKVVDTGTIKPEFFYRGKHKPIWAETITTTKLSNVTRTAVNNFAIALLEILDPTECTYKRDDTLQEDMIMIRLGFEKIPTVVLTLRVSDDKAKLTEH